MYRCHRCGTSFGEIRAAGLGRCPRCRARDGVSVPLSYIAPGSHDDDPLAETPRIGERRQPASERRAS